MIYPLGACDCPEAMAPIPKGCKFELKNLTSVFFTEDLTTPLPLDVFATMEGLITAADIVVLRSVIMENTVITAGEAVNETVDSYEKNRGKLASTFSCQLINLTPAQQAAIRKLKCVSDAANIGAFFGNEYNQFIVDSNTSIPPDYLPFEIKAGTMFFGDRGNEGANTVDKNMFSFQFDKGSWGSPNMASYSPPYSINAL